MAGMMAVFILATQAGIGSRLDAQFWSSIPRRGGDVFAAPACD